MAFFNEATTRRSPQSDLVSIMLYNLELSGVATMILPNKILGHILLSLCDKRVFMKSGFILGIKKFRMSIGQFICNCEWRKLSMLPKRKQGAWLLTLLCWVLFAVPAQAETTEPAQPLPASIIKAELTPEEDYQTAVKAMETRNSLDAVAFFKRAAL